ncbi:unnamed protein product [Prunus armeniaca]|uniref:UBZ4-type domain-containing protein n=1 Tax=Prunus armeniaca TaxID=36596 RepID=A0A6J5WRK4_PRUAR|nr:unnamed protein product [Prunus armeniaca]CAB4304340.1 unnamed protein product [Prunus armeniaca]
MAVAFEGFSIREYAAKMRTVDVFKSYPFTAADNHDADEDDEDMKEKKKKKKKEQVEALLPPITITKFKWWAHELHRLRASTNPHPHHPEQMLTLVNKESSDIPRNDIEFTAVADELEAEVESQETQKSSETSSSLVCPVCKDFSSATVNAVNAHIDSCLAQASREERRQMRKAKSKVPKKRSIAEIFAVAPQIQNHYEEDEDGDDEDCELLGESGGDSSFSVSRLKPKKVKKRKKEKKKVVLLEENKKFNKKMVMKNKKNKKKKNDGLIANKEKSCKLKLQNPVTFAKKLNKKFALDIWDGVTVRARTPNLKYLSTKKRKVVQTSKLIPKHQKQIFAVRSILKNHDVCGQNSAFCSMQGDSQANPRGIQHSERHVRFSDKNHILGPRKNGLSSFQHNTVGNLSSDIFVSSSEKDQSADSNKEAAPMEVDRRENHVSIGTDNGTEACSIIGRKELPKISDHADIPNFLRPHITHQEKVKHLPDKSVPASRAATEDNNLSMFGQGYPIASHKPAYAGIPRLISALEEPHINTHGVAVSRAFGSSGTMIDHIAHPIHGVAAMSSRENAGAFPEPFSSSFTFNEIARGGIPFPSESEIDKFSDHGLHRQSLCPPMNLMGASYPFPEWKQRAGSFRERCLDEDFIGLPLNSHGELIQLSPTGRSGFNQLRKLDTIAGTSSSLPVQNFTQLMSTSSLPAHNFTHRTSMEDSLTAYKKHFVEKELPNDQLNLFPMQNYVKENFNSHFPDRLGVTYLDSTQRAGIHQLDFESSRSSYSFHPLDSGLNLMNISTSGCRQFDQVQNQKTVGMIPMDNSGHTSSNMNQPTMRLMGKDVAIGKSSREIQGFEDGKVWTDKEIIAEHCPSSTALHSSSLNKNFQQSWLPDTASGKLKETVAQSSEIHSEHASLQNFLMKAPEYRFPHPYHNWQSNSDFQNGSLTTDRSPSSNLIHFAQLPTSPAMFNRAPNFPEAFISGAESLQFGSQLPVFSAPQTTCGHGVLRPAEFNYKQNPPHFTKSAFDFPFLNPECRENVQSPWFQSSSKGLPPWLLHATLQGKPPNTASQSFPDVGRKNHHHIMPRSDIFTAPFMHHSSEFSYPCNLMTYHSQVMSSPSPATTFLPPHAPANTGGNQKAMSAINMGYRNRTNVKDRLKSKDFGIKDPYPCKKTKRLAVKAVDSTIPPNMFNLEMQEKLSAVAGSSRGNFFSEMQSTSRALDVDLSRTKASDLGCSLHEIQEDGFGSFGIESSKVDGMVKSGPIKLCAGAKHILKPTQNVDQDISRPIHSTIPFVAVPNGCREPEPQKKSTKIYRF